MIPLRFRILVGAVLAASCGDVKGGGTGGSGGGSVDAPQIADAASDAGPMFMLTVSTTGAGMGEITAPGGIDCGNGHTACSAAYAMGTVVTLTASPGATSAFGSWTGDCTGNSATCMLTMDADHSTTAMFLHTFNLTVQPMAASSCATPPNGAVVSTPAGISCQMSAGTVGGTCAARFPAGTTVQLTATPGTQTAADCISGACSAGSCTQNQPGAISCSTVMDADKTAQVVLCGLMF